jgi:hypothetical protein
MYLHYTITRLLIAAKASRQINTGVQPESQLNGTKRLIITNNGDYMLVTVYNVIAICRAAHVHYGRTIKVKDLARMQPVMITRRTTPDNNECKWILLVRRVSLCLWDWLASSH